MPTQKGLLILLLLGLPLAIVNPGFAVAQFSMSVDPFDTFPPSFPKLVELSEKNPPLADAIRSFNEGNESKLRESLLKARAVNPDFPAVEIMVSRFFMAAGQWPTANSILEAYVVLNPEDAEAYKSFAELAMVSGRWSDAQLQLEKADSKAGQMKFSPARKIGFNAELLRLLGETAERRKDFAAATKFYQELAQYQPRDGYPFWAQGRVKISSGDVQGGAELLKKGRLLTKTLPQPELSIGMELASLPETRKEAEKWFIKGIQEKETLSETNWTQFAQYLINYDRAKDALALLEKVPEDYRRSRDIRLLQAISHRYLGDNSAAEAILSELYKANPDDLDCADHLALVLAESVDQGKVARAIQISESNLRQAQNNEKIVATAAWVQFKAGTFEIADRILGEVVKGGRFSSQTAYYSAMLLKARGKQEEAIQFLKMAVDSGVSFPQKESAKIELSAYAAKPLVDGKK
jgi:tetratricopeptide (TPR) repeat protein